jgi:hypothetical protein
MDPMRTRERGGGAAMSKGGKNAVKSSYTWHSSKSSWLSGGPRTARSATGSTNTQAAVTLGLAPRGPIRC